MIVIDASLAIDLCVGNLRTGELVEELKTKRLRLFAPEVLGLEFVQTLRRFVRNGEATVEQAQWAFANLDALAVERLSHAAILPRIWALRDNLTAYDAAYFALAEWLDAPLWTRDSKFRGVPGHHARVEVV